MTSTALCISLTLALLLIVPSIIRIPSGASHFILKTRLLISLLLIRLFYIWILGSSLSEMTDNVKMDENGIANMVALYAVRNKAPITLVDINPDDQQIASPSSDG